MLHKDNPFRLVLSFLDCSRVQRTIIYHRHNKELWFSTDGPAFIKADLRCTSFQIARNAAAPFFPCAWKDLPLHVQEQVMRVVCPD